MRDRQISLSGPTRWEKDGDLVAKNDEVETWDPGPGAEWWLAPDVDRNSLCHLVINGSRNNVWEVKYTTWQGEGPGVTVQEWRQHDEREFVRRHRWRPITREEGLKIISGLLLKSGYPSMTDLDQGPDPGV